MGEKKKKVCNLARLGVEENKNWDKKFFTCSPEYIYEEARPVLFSPQHINKCITYCSGVKFKLRMASHE